MARRSSTIQNIDWVTVLLYLALIFLGWINIYSVGYVDGDSEIFDFSKRHGKQLIWIGMSLILATVILIIDSEFYVTFAYPIYSFLMVMLLAVLIVGVEVNGARSWFQVGGFRIQPAEFAKYGTALAIAKYTSSFNFKVDSFQSLFKLACIMLLPMSLIVLQNDTGSALVYFVFLLVLYREGLSWMILFIGVLLALFLILSLLLNPFTVLVLVMLISLLCFVYDFRQSKQELLLILAGFTIASALVSIFSVLFRYEAVTLEYVLFRSSIITYVAIIVRAIMKRFKHTLAISSISLILILFSSFSGFMFNEVLGQHQRDRIQVFLGQKEDPYGIEFNIIQSKIAIGSGGVTGKGFLNGTQTQFEFVPEQITDFIFCTVGEEWGYLGTTFVIAVFLALMIRLVFLAERQRSTFSRVYGYSVAAILFYHFTINVGMTIGLVPVIGIPLPFFSYGGSSLWFFSILLFTFIRLDSNRLDTLK